MNLLLLTKRTLFFFVLLTVFASLPAQSEVGEEECTTTHPVYDTQFNMLDRDVMIIATRTTSTGLVIAYPDTKEGIADIIKYLNSKGITAADSELATEKYWAQGSTCKRTAGNQCNKYKNCKAGYSCKQVYTGGMASCRCK